MIRVDRDITVVCFVCSPFSDRLFSKFSLSIPKSCVDSPCVFHLPLSVKVSYCGTRNLQIKDSNFFTKIVNGLVTNSPDTYSTYTNES